MLKHRFTIEEVANACVGAFTALRKDLPESIAERLRVARVAYRHGTDMRIFQFNAWDVKQPGVLDRRHINYSVIYDPHCRYHNYWRERGLPCNLFCRFYVNKQRIYDNAELVVRALWQEMQQVEKVLRGWRAHQNEQIIALMHPFAPGSPTELSESIYEAFLELIPYWHRIYAAFCDQYGAGLTAEGIKAVISGRQKFQPSRLRIEHLQEYVRHVPPRLRAEVFARDGHRCVKCGSHDRTAFHADHILPVARGGRTVLANLQTLCAACNLQKGARDQTDFRAKMC